MSFAALSYSQSPLRDAVTAAYRRDERECVQTLLAQASMPEALQEPTRALARRLVAHVREQRTKSSGVDALMHEFSLSSEEGVALMCLAEALLRIPDKRTADKLIRDKISRGNWKNHLGNSSSLFVNVAAWGLLVTGKLVSSHSEQSLSSSLTRVIAKGGEPMIRKGVDVAMRMLGRQFVTGETIGKALESAKEREAKGYTFSYDMLGEAAVTSHDAQRYFNDYADAIHAIGKASNGRGVYDGPGVSVKLSAIHPRYSRAQHERVMEELYPCLKELFLLAKKYDIGLNIDSEEADRLELSLDLMEKLAFDPDLAGFTGIGIVAQAYQKRCSAMIDFLVDLARRSGQRFMVRLVKGAYWDAEIKRAQMDGMPGYAVFTRKVYTDVSYVSCAKKLLDAQDAIYPQFATHNAQTLSAVYHLAGDREFEFQCLHGMGETLYNQIVEDPSLKKRVRIYAPVGSHETLLAYLVRRLLENGANSSFVSRIVDESISIDDLTLDPVPEAARLGGLPHSKIPLPPELYGNGRKNSLGLDLTNEHTLATLQIGLQSSEQQSWLAQPLLGDGDISEGERTQILNPADHREVVGEMIEATAEQVDHALLLATDAAPRWAATPPTERAACLERMADAMEANIATLMGLAVREAGKSLSNAIAEVREAVDFCRYYAVQTRHELDNAANRALGPVVAISPWNFPLAIFIGEVSAALAAGNPVLAKPAEQTSLIGTYAVRLFHQAGVPRDVLQLLPGRGETVGAALTGDSRVKGVIFTGSTEVAQIINRTLAERGEDVPLIAETGGQNAMIVDSSALAEQVVADVLTSAFDSAGQRCSALRVLYVQEDVADRLITMIRGAMDELATGNPAQLATDVGPVIDGEAQSNLMSHIECMKKEARSWHQVKLHEGAEHGTFVPPTLFEIDNINWLKREVFGPVLHVIRYQNDELEQVIKDINSTGYGLTFGMHSRIDESIDTALCGIEAGNLYINRNIVGAVVGVQPFGGEGLSGTGPKAGGPFYLYRLMQSPQWRARYVSMQHPVQLSGLDVLSNALPKLNLTAADIEQMKDLIDQQRDLSPLSEELELPGPTGESNRLCFAARGKVGLSGGTLPEQIEALVALLATGNRVLVTHAEPLSDFTPVLDGWVDQVDDLANVELSAVVALCPAEQLSGLRSRLAARSGALVPLLTKGEEGINLRRLVVERAISINTAAAGGNARLLSMSE